LQKELLRDELDNAFLGISETTNNSSDNNISDNIDNINSDNKIEELKMKLINIENEEKMMKIELIHLSEIMKETKPLAGSSKGNNEECALENQQTLERLTNTIILGEQLLMKERNEKGKVLQNILTISQAISQ